MCGYCAASRSEWDGLVRQLGVQDTAAAITYEAPSVGTGYFGPRVEVLHAISAASVREALGPEFVLEVPITIVVGRDGRILGVVRGQLSNEDGAGLAAAILAARSRSSDPIRGPTPGSR
jgi:hypothetical protein